MGVISPVGLCIEAYFEGLCGPAPVGERKVTEFNPTLYYNTPKEARRADRFTQFTIAAATEAITQAGKIDADPTRCATMIGTGLEVYPH